MPKPELTVLIPTRGRPSNIWKVIAAWDFTNAWDHADMLLITDADDPMFEGYRELAHDEAYPLRMHVMSEWMPMVHKLNYVAANLARTYTYTALGFAGDDHLPQTIGWVPRYLQVLGELGSGMVFGDDGYQGSNLSTEWAVTTDAVRALGRMVPAPVEHMYCDNSMMDLFGGAGALRHLPEVRIEHMHPIVGKAASDEQYKRVNHRDQFKKDKADYDAWRRSGMLADIQRIRELRPGRPDVRPQRALESRLAPGSMPRAVAPRPRGRKPMTRFGIPRHFKRVRGATPDEIGVTLADFATQVPADQAIVELGVFQGRTALLMAWGARQGNGAHVFGIDAWNLPGNTYGPPFNELGSKTWADYNVMALGYNSSITLVQAFAVEAAASWVTSPNLIGLGTRKIGLLFIDDDHSYEGARNAVLAWAPHLAPGAVIALDDYGHPDWPGVKEAADALVSEGFLEPIEIFHERLAVTRLAGAKTPDEVSYEEGMSRPVRHSFEGTEEKCQLCGRPAELHLDNGVSTGVRDLEELIPTEHVLTPPTAITSEGVSPAPFQATESSVLQPMPVERESATGEPVDLSKMTLGQLRALAKKRGIVLGRRKDLKADIIQALADGK